MSKINQKFDKTLVVRISSEQYTKLLEAIVHEGKKGIKSPQSTVDKSKIIRQMITKYTTHQS
jgi:ribosomal protein S17E